MGSCNPFVGIPVKDLPVASVTNYHTEFDDNIISFEEVDEVELVGDKKTDFVIQKVVKEVSRIPRQEYIDSHRNDVGILNILDKVRMNNDLTLFDQTKRKPGKIAFTKDGIAYEEVVDITSMPSSINEASALNNKALSSYESLPSDLKGSKSFADIALMSDKEIDDYLLGVKTKLLEARDQKGGNKDE